MVVYTSDNGYFMDEPTPGDKRFAYEESIRIPLLVRFPGRRWTGRVIDKILPNIDFAPTALDVASEPAHSRMHGRSWKPLVEGTATDWRPSFCYEYSVDSHYPGIPAVQPLRTETAKLIVYPGHDDWSGLFDLRRDPLEAVNLARRPESADLAARLHAEFSAEQAAAR